MRILFNASTNVVGGAIQTATNFILNAINDNNLEWFFVVSPIIHKQLAQFGYGDDVRITTLPSPAKDLNVRKQLRNIEMNLSPDLVYTMSGPAYVKFSAPHVMGCSNGFVTHAEFDVFLIEKKPFVILSKLARVFYQANFFRKADYWIFQTETSREGFVKRLRIRKDRTFVVSNSYGDLFNQHSHVIQTNLRGSDRVINILVPAAAMRHKNLEIIPRVAKQLVAMGHKFVFVLTLPQESEIWREIKFQSIKYNVGQYITNAGPFGVNEAPVLYNSADVIFLPTLLETFSAVYIESMASRRPLVTTDKGFARDICKDSALYFRSSDPRDAALQISTLIRDPHLRTELIEQGQRLLKDVPTVRERYHQIVDILISVTKK